MRDLALLGGVRDRDLPLRATGVGERDLSLRLALDFVLLARGVPDRSRRETVLTGCFFPERKVSGDELDLSLCVDDLTCLLGCSSGDELRETGTGLTFGEREEEEEEEEEEQLPLSEGERER